MSAEIKETNISYVENVRDIVNFVKTQIEEDLKTIDETSQFNFDVVKKHVSENSDAIKKELQYSYSKLLEIQDSYKELKIKPNKKVNKSKETDIVINAKKANP